MANVIINNETLTGIDTVRLKNADNPSTYVEFKEGGGGECEVTTSVQIVHPLNLFAQREATVTITEV